MYLLKTIISPCVALSL